MGKTGPSPYDCVRFGDYIRVPAGLADLTRKWGSSLRRLPHFGQPLGQGRSRACVRAVSRSPCAPLPARRRVAGPVAKRQSAWMRGSAYSPLARVLYRADDPASNYRRGSAFGAPIVARLCLTVARRLAAGPDGRGLPDVRLQVELVGAVGAAVTGEVPVGRSRHLQTGVFRRSTAWARRRAPRSMASYRIRSPIRKEKEADPRPVRAGSPVQVPSPLSRGRWSYL